MTKEAEPGAVSDGTPARGIYDCDDAYRTPSQSDYERLFTSGVIVLDTNVLLNLYRSNERTRKDTFAVLRQLKEQIWIPHQVVAEFWRNRDLPSVRGHHKAKARDVCSALDKAARSTKDALDRWLKDVHLVNDSEANRKVDEARDSIAHALVGLKRFIEEQARKDALEGTASTQTDPILLELEPLLDGRIGDPFSREEHEVAVREAVRRADEKIPPGYEDIAKEPDRAAGDYLVWAQLLEEASRRQKDVLLVTGDVKEDWWVSSHGQGPARPRTELRVELRRRAGVELFMLTPSQLLAQADRVYGLKVDQRSVSDLATNEYVGSAEWLPRPLIAVLPRCLSRAHEMAKRSVEFTTGKTVHYGRAMHMALLKELIEVAEDFGGTTAHMKQGTYPVVGNCVLVPLRYSTHQASLDHALGYLNSDGSVHKAVASWLRRSLSDAEQPPLDIPGLIPSRPPFKPVLLAYASNWEDGVISASLGTLRVGPEGGFGWEHVEDLHG
ncbi:PIN-like domain-containing protein [Streptomyces sp. NPDC057412]|uniref:PIN-like domain-containing protein n=1 Tax=Streptomyces sp. NPDC057412 TaxID=3346123 RepID=UPI0036BB50BE